MNMASMNEIWMYYNHHVVIHWYS